MLTIFPVARPAQEAQHGTMQQATFPIRAAQPEEHEALEALEMRAALANPGDRAFLLANPELVTLNPDLIAQGSVLVAEDEARIIGFAALLPVEKHIAELDALFVEPDCWGRGTGRRLLAAIEKLARQRGATHLFVVGNPHAVAFYAHNDFRLVGSRKTSAGDMPTFEKVI